MTIYTDEALDYLEANLPSHNRDIILNLLTTIRLERQAKRNAEVGLRLLNRELEQLQEHAARPFKLGGN